MTAAYDAALYWHADNNEEEKSILEFNNLVVNNFLERTSEAEVGTRTNN